MDKENNNQQLDAVQEGGRQAAARSNSKPKRSHQVIGV